MTVRIPPGIASGQVLRLPGAGHDRDGTRGDLFVTVQVAAHPVLRRRGDDLLARMPIGPELARAGGELRVPWLDGEATVHVPPGAAHRSQIVRRGWGMVCLGSPYAPPPADEGAYRSGSAARGDLIVELWTDPNARPAPHEVLDVAPSASTAEIEAAYRALVAANGGATPELDRAYRALNGAPPPLAHPARVWAFFALSVLVAIAVYYAMR